ncbi:alpha/beta hydrolase [Thermaurantiacus sp.]
MADGLALRAFVLSHPAPRAAALVLGGRADFLEKWADPLAALHGLGLRILAFDWRGQGGSGREAGNGAGHITSFDRWLDDLDRVAAFAAAELAGPWVAVAHSMGAHLLLRWLAEGRDRLGLAAAVLTAPMVDLAMPRLTRRLAVAVAKAKVRRGRGTDFAWGQKPWGPGRASRARMALLSGDRERFLDEARWVAANPALGLGGVSWGWLAAADTSIRALRAARLEAIAIPILLLLAGRDRLVSNAAARALARRLPEAEVVELAGSGHEILRERAAVRGCALSQIRAFLDRTLP